MKTHGLRRALAVGMLLAFLPLATSGCYGKFELTRKVWRWNGKASPDKWIQEIIFLVLSIVPIYGGAVFLDAVAFNSIEFWTGRNPVLAANGAQKVVRGPEGERITFTRVDMDTLDVVVERDGESYPLRLVRDADGLSALDPDGQLIARAVTLAGVPTVVASPASGG